MGVTPDLMNIQCDVFHNSSPPLTAIVPTALTEYIAFMLISMTNEGFGRELSRTDLWQNDPLPSLFGH